MMIGALGNDYGECMRRVGRVLPTRREARESRMTTPASIQFARVIARYSADATRIGVAIASWSAFLVLATPRASTAQGGHAIDTVATSTSPPGIQDNSFLIEEAYNQDRGVVQHISSFVRATRGTEYEFLFVQEWPIGGITHQLSYSIPIVHTNDSSARAGIGDVALNYRYQLGNNGGGWAVAPRATIVLPTGAWRRGRGMGGAGYDAFIPASLEIGRQLVTHANAGVGYTPRARTPNGHGRVVEYTLGESLIWLVDRNVNLLTEMVWTKTDARDDRGRTERSTDLQLSPGIRTALNFRSGLQIVPGFAVPLGIGASRGERSVFLYLSFEHPFTRGPR